MGKYSEQILDGKYSSRDILVDIGIYSIWFQVFFLIDFCYCLFFGVVL